MNTKAGPPRSERSRGNAAKFVALAFTLVAPAPHAEVTTESTEIDGIRIEYKVVLPNAYDPQLAYPGVLAFPGAGQTMRNVDRALTDNWRDEAERRGYIVISPAAPEQGLFFQGGDAVFPAYLDELLRRYRIRGGKFHIAGISNGGASAFHIAAAFPEYFVSLTGLPGYLPYLTAEKIESLATLCVYMHVGERDIGWIDTMSWQAQQLTDAGGAVRFWIEKNQGHVMDTLKGDGATRLFEHFGEAETGCRP